MAKATVKNKQDSSGFCSWCYKKSTPERSGVFFKRILYRCPECKRQIARCLAPSCTHFARFDKVEKWRQFHWFCGEHRHGVANFDTLSDTLQDPTEYLKIYEYRKPNLSRLTKSVLLIAGTTIIFWPLSAYAGPAIGSVIGRLAHLSGAAAVNFGLSFVGGGPMIAGGFGIAGGLSVITAVGTALGAVGGALICTAYFGKISGFSVKKIKDGQLPAIITINGFLSEHGKSHEVWGKGILTHYPAHAWYHISWESKKLAHLGLYATEMGAKKILQIALEKAAKGAIKSAAKKVMPFAAAQDVMAVARNDWHVTFVKSEQTGVLLADILKRCKNQNFILCGHSLGCRVIYSCLRTLVTTGGVLIESVHLLGGAVDNDSSNWAEASKAVSAKIYNYHSSNDDVLKIFYTVGTFFQSAPAGRFPIPGLENKIENVDVSSFVPGHMTYIPACQRFLNR